MDGSPPDGPVLLCGSNETTFQFQVIDGNSILNSSPTYLDNLEFTYLGTLNYVDLGSGTYLACIREDIGNQIVIDRDDLRRTAFRPLSAPGLPMPQILMFPESEFVGEADGNNAHLTLEIRLRGNSNQIGAALAGVQVTDGSDSPWVPTAGFTPPWRQVTPPAVTSSTITHVYLDHVLSPSSVQVTGPAGYTCTPVSTIHWIDDPPPLNQRLYTCEEN